MSFTLPTDLPPEEPMLAPSVEEVLEQFRTILQSGEQEAPQLVTILDGMIRFLEEKPAPPASWQERFAKHGGTFDYHQIALPDDMIDPYLDEVDNLQRFKDSYGAESFLAMEHFLLTHNYFLFINQHMESIYCPRPVLMLESSEEDQEVDWDCAVTFFADGSVATYNLEGEREEVLGRDAREILACHMDTLRKLQVRIPKEGEDFGDLSVTERFGCDE